MKSQWLPIAEIADKVQAGDISAIALVEQSLKTIEEKSSYKAIIATTKKRALERAKAIDTQVQKGESVGPLAGVPFIAKDNFLVFGADTTAASNILKGFDAPYQSTAIERLEAAGAICVAKANLDAFAHGSSTENSDFFTTKNPVDPTKVPGGSSGGSAASVTLDMAPFALGTDTGGSIRLPASFCGAVGYKPTYGLVSRSGVIAMASSTDVIGPITRTVKDAAVVLDVMSGRDSMDSTTIEKDPRGYINTPPIDSKPTIGVIKEYFEEGIDASVKKEIESKINELKGEGFTLKTVSLPSLPLALACYYILCPAEVSSNLSRYDGQRYGHSSKSAKNLEESYIKSRTEGFGKEAKRRIMIGTYVLSSGYYDAYYRKAQTVRSKLIQEFQAVFEDVDFLVGPTAPVTAFDIGKNNHDPLAMYLTDIMTVAANLAGVPAISLPAGTVRNLPVGMQLMAPQKHDRELLTLSETIEGIVR